MPLRHAFLPIFHLHQFRHVKAIHVVNMRVNPSCFPQTRVISLINELHDALGTHRHQLIHINHLHEPLLQRIVHHLLILQGRHRTCWIHNHSSHPHAIYCCQNQLLLNVRILVNVYLQSIRLNRLILRYYAQTGAWRIQKHLVKSIREYLRIFAAIPTSDDGVGDAQSIQVEL